MVTFGGPCGLCEPEDQKLAGSTNLNLQQFSTVGLWLGSMIKIDLTRVSYRGGGLEFSPPSHNFSYEKLILLESVMALPC